MVLPPLLLHSVVDALRSRAAMESSRVREQFLILHHRDLFHSSFFFVVKGRGTPGDRSDKQSMANERRR